MANVKLENVFKVYDGDVEAVKDFNLDIKDKEFVVFVGPSGCGKSTTLRMIAGLEDISKGEISIDNTVINDVTSKDRDIAMVFQNYALYPHMTVYENMAFGLKLRKMDKKDIEEKVTRAAKILDIEPLLKRKPKALSGGQKQRVAIGRAIVRQPKVFLMDEPLSNLDAKLRVQMRTEIVKLYRQLETTFIYVTHDQIEAMTMGTRIVVMNNGVIQQADTPDNIYNFPKNIFVAGFIGSPQMNFQHGIVEKYGESYFANMFNTKIEISKDKGEFLNRSGYIGKEVVFGIRPEHISESQDLILKNPNSVFSTNVDIIENMGAECYIYSTCGGKNVNIRSEGKSNLNVGECSKFYINALKIHIFDKESEERIV